MREQPAAYFSDTRERPAWFAPLGLVAAVLPALAMVVLAKALDLPFGLVDTLALTAVAVALTATALCGVVRVAYGRRPRRLRVDHRGIMAYFYGRLVRFYPWTSVEQVVEEEGGVRLKMRRGELLVDNQVTDWPRLAVLARAALGQAEPEPAAAPMIPPEALAEWLGVEPGGVLRSGTTATGGMAVAGAVALVVLLGVTVSTDVGWLAAPFLVAVALAAGAFLKALAASPLRLNADAWGLHVLTITGWRSYGWDSFQDYRIGDGLPVLVTRHGDIRLDSASLPRPMMTAIERVIRARREGAELPQVAEVPEGALSRMEDDGEERLADHGLSRVDE